MPIALALALTFIAFVALNAARVALTLYALTLGAPASSVNAFIMAATGLMTHRGAQRRGSRAR